jgi:hypothetical protein
MKPTRSHLTAQQCSMTGLSLESKTLVPNMFLFNTERKTSERTIYLVVKNVILLITHHLVFGEPELCGWYSHTDCIYIIVVSRAIRWLTSMNVIPVMVATVL